MSDTYISESALIHESSIIGRNVRIWHNAKIREKVILGENIVIGDSVYIGPEVRIGKNSKIQNCAQIYEPAIISEGVFIGPGVIITNDHNPRAINVDKSQKSGLDWNKSGVEINEGASIGAGAICVGPIEIGAWAMIGAGAVVVDSVLSYALVVGVPAKQIGYVGKAGIKLVEITPTSFRCPDTNRLYKLNGINLVEEI